MSARDRESLDGVIGDQVRAIRKLRGWTRDDLRRELAEQGFRGLSLDVLQAIEQGSRRIRLSDLLALAWTLRVSPVDLIRPKGSVVLLEEGVPVDAPALRDFLQAGKRRRRFVLTEDSSPFPRGLERLNIPDEDQRAAEEWLERFAPAFKRLAPTGRERDLAWTFGAGQLERRIASSLGVPPVLVGAAANRLWGRSATERRNKLAESPRHRHSVSRKLRREIQDVLAKSGALEPTG